MRKAFVFLFVITVFAQCESDSTEDCSTPATVRDLTGLDGCGWVFELENGIRLEPFWDSGFCGFKDDTENDPLVDFEFIDGKRVFINYEIMGDRASICMVGPIARITCISEASTISAE